MDPEKELRIKTQVCQRLLKEVKYYEKEVLENETTLQKMKDEQKDPYDIKKFAEVLGESKMMVPDSKRRLEEALEELYELVQNTEATEWLDKAKEILDEHYRDNQGEEVHTNLDGVEGDEF